MIGYMIDDSKMESDAAVQFGLCWFDQERPVGDRVDPLRHERGLGHGLFGGHHPCAPRERACRCSAQPSRSTMRPAHLTKGMTATATVSAGSAGTVLSRGLGHADVTAGKRRSLRRSAARSPRSAAWTTPVTAAVPRSCACPARLRRMRWTAPRQALPRRATALRAAQREVCEASSSRASELRDLISDSTIKSPIDGVVVSLNAVADPGVHRHGAAGGRG